MFAGKSASGTDSDAVSAIASGSTLGLEQALLASAGQPALTVLAVGFVTSSGKVQGVSLGDGNVIEVYTNGANYNSGTVLYREFMSLGEPICFTGLANGAIITSTQGFYGFSEQLSSNGNDESPMPLLSYGLSFKSTFLYPHRNANENEGFIRIVNGPLANVIKLTDGSGTVILSQEDISLDPWEFSTLTTDGVGEYILSGTNPMMACFHGEMDTTKFYDSRLIMPLTNDGITWPRSGRMSSPYVSVNVDYFVRDNAQGNFSVTSGTPVNIETETGANDSDYEPDGATRFLATGLISAFSGADSAGIEATPLMPTSGMSQVVAQPLYIADNADGGNSGVAISSPYIGTAKIYSWNGSGLTLEYTVPLNRNGVTVASKEDQKHPSAGMVANETVNGAILLVGQLDAGVVIADVPITVVVQNGVEDINVTLRSQNGSTTTSISDNDDETLSLGWTPPSLKAEITEGTDGILYKRVITGGVESWEVA